MMLSSIARAASQRLGARVSHSVPKLQRVILVGNASSTATRDQFMQLHRGYATAAQVTKTKKPAAKKAIVAKKPAATKAPTKAAAKKKPVKKAAKKPAKKAVKKPVKKPTKVLTEEQKAKKAEKAQKVLVNELRTVALLASEPKQNSPTTAYFAVQKEVFKNSQSKFHGSAVDINASFKERIREIKEKYNNLNASELERYNQFANQNKAQFESSYKAWVQGHSAEEIRLANNARAKLARLTKKPKAYRKIHDDRSVSLPRTAYFLYSMARWNSGDLKGVPFVDAAKLISAEYKKLSDSERKPYLDKQEAEVKRYDTEYAAVYGHPTPAVQAAAAAATAA